MRTLAISDIHGNIDALQAIDEDYDNIVCMGDITDYGPDPVACIEFLQERDVIRAVGNHDCAVAFRVDCRTPSGPYRSLSIASREHTWSVISDMQARWLGKGDAGVYADHGSLRLFACHGAPSDLMYKYLTPHTSDEELAQEAAMVGADIIVVGHSHMPFVKRLDGKTIVNVGSVGQPRDGIPKVCYAIIENGEAEINRAEYDVESVVAKTRASMKIDPGVLEQIIYILEKAKAPPVKA